MSKEVDKYQFLIVQKDSLIRLKQDSIQVLSRELTKTEQKYITLGKYTAKMIWTLVVAVIGLLIWLWHRKK